MWRSAEIIAERGGKNGRCPWGSGMRVAKILRQQGAKFASD